MIYIKATKKVFYNEDDILYLSFNSREELFDFLFAGKVNYFLISYIER